MEPKAFYLRSEWWISIISLALAALADLGLVVGDIAALESNLGMVVVAVLNIVAAYVGKEYVKGRSEIKQSVVYAQGEMARAEIAAAAKSGE